MPIEKLNLNIEYSDSLLTGISEIDQQHRFFQIDTLHDNNYMFFNSYAKDLLSYAITHLETEEKLTQESGYTSAHPNKAQEHISHHRNFSHRIVSINDCLREGLSFNTWSYSNFSTLGCKIISWILTRNSEAIYARSQTRICLNIKCYDSVFSQPVAHLFNSN
jgi:hypothetical protein